MHPNHLQIIKEIRNPFDYLPAHYFVRQQDTAHLGIFILTLVDDGL